MGARLRACGFADISTPPVGGSLTAASSRSNPSNTAVAILATGIAQALARQRLLPTPLASLASSRGSTATSSTSTSRSDRPGSAHSTTASPNPATCSCRQSLCWFSACHDSQPGLCIYLHLRPLHLAPSLPPPRWLRIAFSQPAARFAHGVKGPSPVVCSMPRTYKTATVDCARRPK